MVPGRGRQPLSPGVVSLEEELQETKPTSGEAPPCTVCMVKIALSLCFPGSPRTKEGKEITRFSIILQVTKAGVKAWE